LLPGLLHLLLAELLGLLSLFELPGSYLLLVELLLQETLSLSLRALFELSSLILLLSLDFLVLVVQVLERGLQLLLLLELQSQQAVPLTDEANVELVLLLAPLQFLSALELSLMPLGFLTLQEFDVLSVQVTVVTLLEGDLEHLLRPVRLDEEWVLDLLLQEVAGDGVAHDLLWREGCVGDVEDESTWILGVGIVVVHH